MQRLPLLKHIKLSKKEGEFVKTLLRGVVMAKSKSGFNKLDDPLKNVSALNEQISWEEYDYKNKFEYVCEIKANANEERLEFVDQVEENMNRSCVYAMVINGKIFKIGAALRGIKGRIGSYNSGRTKYRTKGTNSGTNYWVLQSMIKMNVNINIYAHFPPTEKVEILGVGD